MFWPQKVCRIDHFLLRIPDDMGGPGNPSAPIGFNGKSATNFRSLSAMHVAEFHGNTRRDGPTRIHSIAERGVICMRKYDGARLRVTLMIVVVPSSLFSRL